MKARLLVIGAFVLAVVVSPNFDVREKSLAEGVRSGTTAELREEAFVINKRLGRGVNIIGYDPLWRDRSRARFRAEYFPMIREAGFTHVRINLHPFRDNPRPSGDPAGLREDYLATLDWAVDEALRAGLMVVLDFHEFQALGKDLAGHRNRYLACWEVLARRQQNRPPEVLFELLNEPNSAVTPEEWNKLLREALAIVRQTNPKRMVIIGPAEWNNIRALDRLDLPDDPNIIVTVHYYSPFEFTHQGAAFAGRADKVGIRWGSAADRQAVVADFDRVQQWAEKHRRPIYLGEFGVYDRAPQEDRVAWLSFVTQEAEKRGWSWAYWQFDGDFILFDIKTGKWVEPILNAILHKQ